VSIPYLCGVVFLSLTPCIAANLPDESLPPISSEVKTGVYFGFAQVVAPDDKKEFSEDKKILPMVMSLGWNPFYKNERLTAVRCFLSRILSLYSSIICVIGNPHYA
jgi:FAD synthase